jgi:hypothetical protein
MSAVQPTKNTGLIVDEFIRYANQHLLTVKGMITTVSIYAGPSTAPGVVMWNGYQVAGARSSRDGASSVANDLFIGEDANTTPIEQSYAYLSDDEAITIADEAMKDMDNSINNLQINEETYKIETTTEYLDSNSEKIVYAETANETETKSGVNGLGNGVPDKIIKKIENKVNSKKVDANGVKFKGNRLQTHLQSKGWLNSKEQPFRRTIVDPKEWGPKLKKTYGINIAKAMLSCMQNEQGFKGFNNNIGGFDITAGGWEYNEKLHDGYVFVPEGTTGLLKAFVSFKTLDTFFEKISVSFVKKGMDKVTTEDQFSKAYYDKWLGGDSATKVAFNTYPNISKAKGGRFETIEDYRNSCKKTFAAIYKGIGRYVS